MSPHNEVTDEDLVEAIKACEAITLPKPATHEVYVHHRYHHGGSRVSIEGESPTLIADFYQKGDREFWELARTLLPRILPELQSLRELERLYRGTAKPSREMNSTLHALDMLRDKSRTILTGASGEKAGVCGTCEGVGFHWCSPNKDEPQDSWIRRDCPDCSGTGQTPEVRNDR